MHTCYRKNGTEFFKNGQGLVCQKINYFRPFSSQHPVESSLLQIDVKCLNTVVCGAAATPYALLELWRASRVLSALKLFTPFSGRQI